MTFLHFTSCIGIALGPMVILYYTKLSDSRPFYRVIFGALGYLLCQSIKLILLATIIPSSIDSQPILNNIIGGLLNVVDVFGLYYFISNIPSQYGVINNSSFNDSPNTYRLTSGFTPKAKSAIVTLGFAFGELITSRVIPIWVLSRQREWDWAIVSRALDANAFMILTYFAASLLEVSVVEDKEHEKAKQSGNSYTSKKGRITFFLVCALFVLAPFFADAIKSLNHPFVEEFSCSALLARLLIASLLFVFNKVIG